MLSPELGSDMRRREFITLIGGAVAAWPLTARAEVQSAAKMYRVGFLLGATGKSVAPLFHALRDRLQELGYRRPQRRLRPTVRRRQDRATSGSCRRLRVDVIVTGTNLHVAAVRHATETISIVMVFTADPVGAGFCCKPGPTRRQCHGLDR